MINRRNFTKSLLLFSVLPLVSLKAEDNNLMIIKRFNKSENQWEKIKFEELRKNDIFIMIDSIYDNLTVSYIAASKPYLNEKNEVSIQCSAAQLCPDHREK